MRSQHISINNGDHATLNDMNLRYKNNAMASSTSSHASWWKILSIGPLEGGLFLARYVSPLLGGNGGRIVEGFLKNGRGSSFFFLLDVATLPKPS